MAKRGHDMTEDSNRFRAEMPRSGIPVGPENQHTGSVHGAVVQAGHIDGGVHLHQPGPNRIVPQQLPGVTWHFTGRTAELARMTGLLDNADGRSGTVVVYPTEPIGGIGTTSLATRWAAEFAARFPDGALYVNLRGADPYAGRPITPDQVIRGFLFAFGVEVPPGIDAQFETYRSVLAGRRVLLLLDDARDAEQVRPLLPGNSACWVVVTSRRPLPDLVATAGAQPIALGPLDDTAALDLLRRHIGEQRVAAEPDAVAELVHLSGGVPLALNVIAAHAAAWPNVPLSRPVAELRAEANWLRQTTNDNSAGPRTDDARPPTNVAPDPARRQPTDSLAARTRVVYSWAQQRADTGPVPTPGWSNAARSVRSLVVWARRPQALVTSVVAVVAATVGVSVPLINVAGVFGIGYLLLHVAVLVGAVVLMTTRTTDRQPAGVGLAAAMAVVLFGDAIASLYSTPTVGYWLYFLATLGYLGVLGARFWPFPELRRAPRFIAPATRPLSFLVLGGAFGQLILLFVGIPYACPDPDFSSCTYTVSGQNGPLGILLFVLPITALCVLVAITEPLDGPRRSFVAAAVIGFFGPELFLMLTSLVLGSRYSYVGDDLGGSGITAPWFVLLNAAMFVAVGVGTIVIARSTAPRRPAGRGVR
jgi:hypothetical protein